jgi:hypothetical protein
MKASSINSLIYIGDLIFLMGATFSQFTYPPKVDRGDRPGAEKVLYRKQDVSG